MKKIEKKKRLMEAYGHFRCPKCQGKLSLEGNSLKCTLGHTYDISKKGTVNFVLGYGEENYSLTMLEARKRVMEEGLFQEVLEALAEEIYEDCLLLGKEGEVLRILDAGCGDGTHIEVLGKALKDKGMDVALTGVDISKDGILLAGRKDNDVLYHVADLASLPFQEEAFDVIVNILSPVNYKDFQRVLTKEGRVYKVIPETGYLKELRKLYGLKEYHNEEIVAHLKEQGKVYKERKIKEEKQVGAFVDDLLLMTPMLWDKEILDPGAKIEQVTIELTLFTFGF